MRPPKTFHQLIAANKRNSWFLIAGMFLLLIALGVVFGGAYGSWPIGLLIALGTACIVFLFSWFAGSGTLLAVSGAHEISKEDDPQLFNVVEEMSIAAGVPMPRVFVINTKAMNAFATGVDPAHAAVAVTEGLRSRLSRDELQGVIAHEIGHIRNFDIRYTMLMAVMAGAIVLLADLFLRSTFFSGGRRRNDRDGGIQAILMLVGIVFAILAPIITALIQMAMSRQREYLADASAVEFTRNPDGLADALAKLAGDAVPYRTSRSVAPLFIVNPELKLRGGAESLFATHPPISERIKRLWALSGGER
ncbi:M48 family metalloprotease [uncultured Victivallis sp.]|uniref:M48 family metalloprotease n=1 Tax=uncultured Victivallis sp. TaxID=354118 RepID=UPI0025CC9407|nr:M48 family metalloprotease [uncultured Victivallis sp.]